MCEWVWILLFSELTHLRTVSQQVLSPIVVSLAPNPPLSDAVKKEKLKELLLDPRCVEKLRDRRFVLLIFNDGMLFLFLDGTKTATRLYLCCFVHVIQFLLHNSRTHLCRVLPPSLFGRWFVHFCWQPVEITKSRVFFTLTIQRKSQ